MKTLHILAAATLVAAPAPAAYVIHISVDGLRPDAITTLGPANLPNFYRMRTQGAFTDNARTDYDVTVTLPNHTTQVTGRGVQGPAGHNWTSNNDPAAGATLASNKGSYVAGVFDVAHDNGLRTGEYASKSKFSLFYTTWSALNGALDATGEDNGRKKIDVYVNTSDTASLINQVIANMNAQPINYTFIHLTDPDTVGHASGWNVTLGSPYLNVIKTMDARLGRIFSFVDTNLQFKGPTWIILTADHGGYSTDHSNPTLREVYTIPFYVWGPGVLAGADLYALNPASRLNPGTGRPSYAAPIQPIRNGEAANVALTLLGLGPVPGSTINLAQNLALTLPSPSDFRLSFAGPNPAISFTMQANARYDLQVCDDLAEGVWSDLIPGITGSGGTVTNIDLGPTIPGQKFFRLNLRL